MEKRLEYALEFLMYSYFGATFKHCDGELSEIEKCAAAKAYNDATMRAALSQRIRRLKIKTVIKMQFDLLSKTLWLLKL